MHRIVIDANVWVKFSRAQNLAPLLLRCNAYDLLAIANNYLLAEVFEAVIDCNWMSEKTATRLINFIRNTTLVTTERATYRLSPDPKDNYLFDLAIQNNCSFVISDDTELLAQQLKPVQVYTSSWFLKHFALE